MAEEIDEQELELTHTGVCVRNKKHIIVSAISDEFAEDQRDHAMIFHYIKGEDTWTQHLIDTHSVTAVCSVEEKPAAILNLGIDGTVFVVEAPFAKHLNAALNEDADPANLFGFRTEIIAPPKNGPTRASFLTCMRTIGTHVYAAGLARQVYRRDGPDQWVKIDEGTYVPPGNRKKGIGFASIDGADEKNIYAVGYKGEIWFYDGKKWAQLDSPTNVYLSQVRCVSKKEVYVCGTAGIVLRGNKAGWQVIEPEFEADDFWGMAVFNEKVYVASEAGIAVINDDALQAVDMKLAPQPSTMYLDSGDGVLWSVGQKDIARTEDGDSWQIIPNP